MRALIAAGLLLAAAPAMAGEAAFPARFDSIGTPVAALTLPAGRKVFYTDTGEAGWKPMLFIGGAGTSARAPELVAFLDTMRRRLKLRIITVERNGFGDTAFDPAWGFGDYVGDVRAVLGQLKVNRFALVAISGGGAYAGHIAAAMPERLTSWHMLAAISGLGGSSPLCGMDDAALIAALKPQVGAPRVWWDMPAEGVAAKVRGFADRTADEGAHAFFIAGQQGDPRGMAAEYKRFCQAPAPATAVRAPAFFYYGEADHTVPPAQGEVWAKMAKGPVTFRRYPGEGHDTQYRHWDQVMLDVSGVKGTLVCQRGKARIMPGLVTPEHLPRGASLGVCAWQKASR
ncbi:MAG: alpha/beta hydrolase [Proteobacteria bacterium]|nr:alpha/beta hydrolase [Pseudomonadota bacterium]